MERQSARSQSSREKAHVHRWLNHSQLFLMETQEPLGHSLDRWLRNEGNMVAVSTKSSLPESAMMR